MLYSRLNRPVLAPLFAFSLAGTLTACGSAGDDAGAAEKTEMAEESSSIIVERQANFESIGDEFKAIRGQLEGGSPDMAAIEKNAQTISANAALITDHFPAGTGMDSGADTEALESIWEKPAEFETAALDLVKASGGLATITSTGDAAAVGEQVKVMGGTCKSCHDKFRLDKD